MEHRRASGLALAAILAVIFALAPPARADNRVANDVFLYSTPDVIIVYSATANTWYPIPFEGSELLRGETFSGRVAVVATSQRILGFSSLTNTWAIIPAIPNEEFLQVSARDDVGVIVTSKRTLGFSAFQGNWSEMNLDYTEQGGYQ
jgi:hypothetical protein